jgi:hypothetical protein
LVSGNRYWRMKYYYGGCEKLIALGVYPEVSLVEVRQRRDEARTLCAKAGSATRRKCPHDSAKTQKYQLIRRVVRFARSRSPACAGFRFCRPLPSIALT